MKKLTSILLISSLLLAAGCSKKDSKETEVVTEPTITESLVYAIGDECKMDGYVVTVNSIESCSIDSENYLIVDICVLNTSDEDINVNVGSAFSMYLDNERAEYVSDSSIESQIHDKHLFFENTSIKAGRQESGYIAYRYYKAYKVIEVEAPDVLIRAKASEVKAIIFEEDNNEKTGEANSDDSSIISEVQDVVDGMSNSIQEDCHNVPSDEEIIAMGQFDPNEDCEYIRMDDEHGIFHLPDSTCYTCSPKGPEWYGTLTLWRGYTPCPDCYPEYYAEHPEIDPPDMNSLWMEVRTDIDYRIYHKPDSTCPTGNDKGPLLLSRDYVMNRHKPCPICYPEYYEEHPDIPIPEIRTE